MKRTKTHGTWLWIGLLSLCAGLTARAAEPTAFELAKEGNRFISEEAKDKVVAIHSEQSVGGLTPTLWGVTYYDIDAKSRATEVKFGGGKKLAVGKPFRPFTRATGPRAIMDLSKLKIDSDEAIKIAQKDGLLDKVKLANAKMVLERWEEMPVWKIRFWAEKARNPAKTADIGEIFINAENGKVVHRDLRIDKVN